MIAAIALFVVAWLAVLIYAVSAIRLGLRVYRLKREGRFPQAPDLFHPLERLRTMGWMFNGRYAALDDPIAARWGRRARLGILAAAPLIVAAVLAMMAATLSANVNARDAGGDRGQQLIGDGRGG